MATRTGRLLKLLQLLSQNRKGMTKKEIGARLDGSIRTVERALDALRDQGFPVVTDDDKRGGSGRACRYRLDAEGFTGLPQEMRPLGLGFFEVFALAAALGSATLPRCEWLDEARESALAKVAIYLPGLEAKEADRLRGAILRAGPDDARHEPIHEGSVRALFDGLRRARVVEVDYPWNDGEGGRVEGSRPVRPLGFVLAHGGLYCIVRMGDGRDEKPPARPARRRAGASDLAIAHASSSASASAGHAAADTAGFRTLNLARARGARLLDLEFVPEERALERFRSAAFQLWNEPPRKVRVRFSPEVREPVLLRRFHPDQKTRVLRDGSVEIEMRVGGMKEVLWWLLPWEDKAELIEPKEWREEMKKILRATMRRYR